MKILVSLLPADRAPSVQTVQKVLPDIILFLQLQTEAKQELCRTFLTRLKNLGFPEYSLEEGSCEIINLSEAGAIDEKALYSRVIYPFEQQHSSIVWYVDIANAEKEFRSAACKEFYFCPQRQFLVSDSRENRNGILLLKKHNERLFIDEIDKLCTQKEVQEAKERSLKANEDSLTNMKLDVLFQRYQCKVANSTDISSQKGKSIQDWEMALCFAKNISQFNVIHFPSPEAPFGKPMYNLDKIEGLPDSVKDEIVHRWENNKNIINNSFFLNNRQAQFVNGRWLETFIWGLLKHNQEHLGISDVVQGLVAHRLNHNQLQICELDVAFLYKQSLRTVECKTGRSARRIETHYHNLNRTISKLGIPCSHEYIAMTSASQGEVCFPVSTPVSVLNAETIKRLAANYTDINLIRETMQL